MSEQIFNTRIVHKHDTEANWNKAVNFIPKQSELIVYDSDENFDYERLKIGDGITLVTELPFVDENISWNILKDRPFGEIANDTLNWDGNTEGLHSLMGMVYKVSDIVPTLEDFAKGGKVVYSNGEIIEFKSDELQIQELNGKYMITEPEGSFMIVPDVGLEAHGYLPGTYFFKGEEKYPSSLIINGYAGFGTIKLLDSKYLNCDQSLDITSNNPVANKVISEEVAKINTAIENLVGKNVTGTSYQIDGTSFTSGLYAEIFNDYVYNKAIGNYSHAEGSNTVAKGEYSHAEGQNTVASGNLSHAEGYYTKAIGDYSHAEGNNTTASNINSHAEGSSTQAIGDYSHAEGSSTQASGTSSHAEGYHTKAIGDYSHAEGSNTQAIGDYSHAEGSNTKASGAGAHAEGLNYTYSIKVTGAANSTTYTLSENENNKYIRLGAMIIYNGMSSIISNYNSDSLTITLTSSLSSEDLNEQTVTLCFGAFGTSAHVEGHNTLASAHQSHAEGYFTTASSFAAHAEGYYTKAIGSYSHAEGNNTTASKINSHAEGSNTIASGTSSHAEGSDTKASGMNSHAEGEYTIASGKAQHVEGLANIEDNANKYIHIAGNGTDSSNRSNAYTLDWNGNGWFAGDITVGANKSSVITEEDSIIFSGGTATIFI